MPGVVGGADWGGSAVDPETGILYVPSVHSESVIGIVPSEHPRSDMRLVVQTLSPLEGPNELPLFKPPYGRLVAIDLKRRRDPLVEGQRRRTARPSAAAGPRPAAARPAGPRLAAGHEVVRLPRRGRQAPGWSSCSRSGAAAGGKAFRAYDKLTGDVVWEMELPGGTTAAPMTYMVDGRQYIVVTVGWEDLPSEYVALALPE